MNPATENAEEDKGGKRIRKDIESYIVVKTAASAFHLLYYPSNFFFCFFLCISSSFRHLKFIKKQLKHRFFFHGDDLSLQCTATADWVSYKRNERIRSTFVLSFQDFSPINIRCFGFPTYRYIFL
jgi:hypothetical protein